MHPRTCALVALLPAAVALAAGAEENAPKPIEELLAERLRGVTIDHVSRSPIRGIYEVAIGARVFYVSADGRYLVQGHLIDLETNENVTERTLAKRRVAVLEEIPEERMIVYEPVGETRHTLTTFTDIDCPFCRKMHREMKELNRLGIRVRYLLFPRAGYPSASYDKAVSVWCAPDRRAEMTRAKSGIVPERRRCEHPVAEHMAIARGLGLTGTPFTITDTGRVISGYRPATGLARALDADRSGKPR